MHTFLVQLATALSQTCNGWMFSMKVYYNIYYYLFIYLIQTTKIHRQAGEGEVQAGDENVKKNTRTHAHTHTHTHTHKHAYTTSSSNTHTVQETKAAIVTTHIPPLTNRITRTTAPSERQNLSLKLTLALCKTVAKLVARACR